MKTFNASNTLVKKVTFGGEFSGAVFAGRELGPDGSYSNFDSVQGYHGNPIGDNLLMGYVLFDDAKDKAISFWWEKSEAFRAASDRKLYDGVLLSNMSIGKVVLTRKIFDEVVPTMLAELAIEEQDD